MQPRSYSQIPTSVVIPTSVIPRTMFAGWYKLLSSEQEYETGGSLLASG